LRPNPLPESLSILTIGIESAGRRRIGEEDGVGQNTETLKAGWDAFKKGDMEAVKETWNDDVTWEGANTDKLPGSGVTKGKDAIIAMFGEVMGDFDDFNIEPDEFVEQGDTVVVLGHLEGKA